MTRSRFYLVVCSLLVAVLGLQFAGVTRAIHVWEYHSHTDAQAQCHDDDTDHGPGPHQPASTTDCHLTFLISSLAGSTLDLAADAGPPLTRVATLMPHDLGVHVVAYAGIVAVRGPPTSQL
ncbi:hypothetical protein [Mucisphaera calidilacus]|uniref:hypothetical protein n=1 Tax=Mucisphaera calidilacus TaxID=2527982 RepID=UPI0011A34892|nr:hypothetical protein [Mucisphaera calidilacus]